MSYEQRRDWGRGRGRGRGRGGDGGAAAAASASSAAGGPGGRGRHPGHLKGREIGLWYARRQGQKNRDADRQQVRDAGTRSGAGVCAAARRQSRRCPVVPGALVTAAVPGALLQQ